MCISLKLIEVSALRFLDLITLCAHGGRPTFLIFKYVCFQKCIIHPCPLSRIIGALGKNESLGIATFYYCHLSLTTRSSSISRLPATTSGERNNSWKSTQWFKNSRWQKTLLPQEILPLRVNALWVKAHWEGSIQIFPFLHENITFTF